MILPNHQKQPLFPSIFQVVLVMAGIQFVRILIYRLVLCITQSKDWYLSICEFARGSTMLLTCMVLLILFQPSIRSLGLTRWNGTNGARWITISGAILLILLAGINILLDQSQLVPTLISCLIFPFLEEILFRGWIWNHISRALPDERGGFSTVLITAGLFAVWHLGYWDVISTHMAVNAPAESILHIMGMKMIIAAIIGLFTGVLRWKTGNIYASMLFHAAWNLFGR